MSLQFKNIIETEYQFEHYIVPLQFQSLKTLNSIAHEPAQNVGYGIPCNKNHEVDLLDLLNYSTFQII